MTRRNGMISHILPLIQMRLGRRSSVVLALLLGVVSSLGAVSSAQAAESDNLLTGYALTSWTDGDGRPLGTVYAIAQDRDGYLWIGAEAGLLRFDGVRFTPWEALSDTPLPSLPASALCVAKDGSLWVGFANGGGIRRIRDGQVRAADQPGGTLGSVSDLIEDHRGTIWAVSDSGLYRLQSGQWERLNLVWEGREPLVQHPFVSSKGELWIGTARSGLFRRIEETDTFERMTPGFMWGLSEDSHGTIWITDIVAGFRRLGEPSSPPRPLEGSGYRLMHDRRGNLWVATLGEGLWRVRPDGNGNGSRSISKATSLRIEQTALRTGLSSDSVQALLEDRENNIWVGTTGGLHRLTERPLTPIENIGFVVAVERTDDSSVWAGTTNGLIRFSTTPGRLQRHRTTSGPGVRVLFRDPRGSLWIGTNEGLFTLRDGVQVPVKLPPQYPLTAITVITPDPRGGIWLLYSDWLSRWDGTTLTRFNVPPDLGLARVTTARTDNNGRVWAAFDEGRIGFLNQDGTFRLLGATEGLRDGVHRTIYSIFADRQGTIWFGGTGGLSRFAQDRIVTVGRQNGLPGNGVLSIVEDDDGYLWLSIDRGLVRVDREEFAKASADAGHRLQHRVYDTSDGLAGAPLGSIRSVRGADGRLWFVRGGGFTLVDPHALEGERGLAPAPVRIEAAVANENRLSPAPQTALPAGTRRLQISYSALTLTASNKIRFRYRLDGFDTDWIDAGTRRQAFYTNLSPLSYQFRVEASTENGTWSPSTATWDFAIRPAFYQTNWFLAASAAMIALAVWVAWRIRLGLVRRQFSFVLAERARLSREIHDTLLQSLVGVALQFDAISATLDSSSSAAKTQLVRIRRQVEAYIREARQSIWDLRSPTLETHDLVAALQTFGKRAAATQPVRFATIVTGTPRRCSPKVENQLLRIGQEAITNAIRHAQARRIHAEFRFDDNSVTLRVSDDGCGFDQQDAVTHETENHYGLMTMRERAEELGAEFKIATALGRGTQVELVVPTL
jgi:signal transduction histidine kinase/ligand-binding sensor domain-containing protein